MTDVFAALAARQVADELAAAVAASARAQARAAVRELRVAQQAAERDLREARRPALVAQAEAVERDRALTAGLPCKLRAAVRYLQAATANGPVTSVDLDAGRGNISPRTLERARARLAEARRLTTGQRGEGAWWVWTTAPVQAAKE